MGKKYLKISNDVLVRCAKNIEGEIIIPDTVKEIGEAAFKECKLTSIVIPNSVTKIGNSAFSHCEGQTSITIPDSVTQIGENVFEGCAGLTSIKVDKNNKVYDSRNDCNAIIETESNTLIVGCKNTVIPDSVTRIGKNAFYGCTGLTSIVIPNSVTEIGDSAFHWCSALTSIVIPDSITEIGFYGCGSLKDIKASPRVIEKVPQLGRLGGHKTGATNEDSPKSDDSSAQTIRIQHTIYRGYYLELIPIIGEEVNQKINELMENGDLKWNRDAIEEIDFEMCEAGTINRSVYFFYKSDEDKESYDEGGPGVWTAGDVDLDSVDDNALDFNICKKDVADDEDLQEDFNLLENLTMSKFRNDEDEDIFNDIKEREDVYLIKNAISRRMKICAKELEEEGLVDNADDVRFILKYGRIYGYMAADFDIKVNGDFDKKLLRPINCEDWSDCGGGSGLLCTYRPDRMLGYIVYDDVL